MVTSILGVGSLAPYGKYLGLPYCVGHSNRAVLGFVKERVWTRLNGWKEKNLSVAGREVLIKSVAQAIPTYIMSCFRFPDGVCHEIEAMVCNFWWGQKEETRKIHWTSWKQLCKSKLQGGMGFRCLQHFNSALLAKQCWRLVQRPQSLVARVFKARYFPQTSFLDALIGSNPSFTWRSIVGSRGLLNAGLRWRVGNGASISIKYDKWVPRPHSFKVILPPSTLSDDARVSDLIDSEKGAWDDERLTQHFLGMDVEAIRCIPLCPTLPSDTLVWHFSRNGEFSVRSAYHLCMDMASLDGHGATSSNGQSHRHFWHGFWQLHLPTKLKIFGWKMCLGLLAVRANLRQRHIVSMDLCPGCGVEAETVGHCFHNCHFAMKVWMSSSLNLAIKPSPVSNCLEWVCQLLATIGPEPMQLFIAICWCLWNNRNSILFDNKSRTVEEVVSFAVKYVAEYDQAQERGHLPAAQVRMRRWVVPREGIFKLNFDGSVRKAQASAGVGVIIRDCHGEVIASMVERIPYMEDVDCVEAMGAIKALQLGCNLGLGHIHLEGDSQNVVAAIQGKVDNLSCYGHLVGLAQELLLRFLSSSVSHVCRDGNSVAHCLSRLAFDFDSPRVWMEEVPPSLMALAMSEASSSV